MKRFIWEKLILFSVFFILGALFFNSRPSEAAHQNAFICCLIDDMSFQYKTVVFYTGEEIEIERLSRFYDHDFFIDDSADARLSVGDHKAAVEEETNRVTGEYPAFETTISSDMKGRISVEYKSEEDKSESIKSYIKEMGGSFYSVDEGSKYALPLTFPADTSIDAAAGDINRAYAVAETLGDGFNSALLFINDGQSYISTYQLMDAAYGLATIPDGGYLVGPTGSKYKINFVTEESVDGGGYQYNCKITEENFSRDYRNQYAASKFKDPSGEVIGSGSFAWKMKKGYKASSDGDVMEDGSHNTIAEGFDTEVADTTYISWEHLFVSAGTLYAQGITYANQADIYSMDALEDSVVSFIRNLLTGLTGYIDTFSMEDLIFNNGVRGSAAYYFGTFNKNWSDYLLNMFLVFAAIAVSMVFFIVVRMILKKNLSTANIYDRVSLMEEIKDLLISLFFIAFAWGAIRVAMLINFEFVGIWGALAEGKSLSTIHSSSVLFSGIVIQFVYFVLEIYVNYIYIIRGLVIAALIITSPLFILAFNFGRKGKAMTASFLRELLGSIFLQSFHAFIYGMLLAAASGTRGIESIVIVASVIPLTTVFKEATGSGGDAVLKTAERLTETTVSTGSAAVGMGASLVGRGLETVGGAAGGVFAGVGKIAGGAADVSGGLFQLGSGVGLSLSGAGSGSSGNGISRVERGESRMLYGGKDMTEGLGVSADSPQMEDVPDIPGNILRANRNTIPQGKVVDTASIEGFTDAGFTGRKFADGSLGYLSTDSVKRSVLSSRAVSEFGSSGVVESGVDRKTGRTFLQMGFTAPNGLREDLSSEERALWRAVAEREDAAARDKQERSSRNISEFNRKYGVSYSGVEYERDRNTGLTSRTLILGSYMGEKDMRDGKV